MAHFNNEFEYQNKVFDRFLNSLFPIDKDKEEDKEEKERRGEYELPPPPET